MDLGGHELADRFGDIEPVTPQDFGRLDAPRSAADGEVKRSAAPNPDERSQRKGKSPDGDVDSGNATNIGVSDGDTGSGTRGRGGPSGKTADDAPRACVSDIASPFQTAADEQRDTSTPDSPHPMLSKEQWADLQSTVPEVTESLGSLTELASQLQTFQRPMGPDEAVTVMQGLEALNRIVDLLSAVTLSVFERTGTPKDYGAKTTKSLVQDKLKLSGREAHRRTELAKNLGNRVDGTGQSRPPKYPLVAEGLKSGRLSSSQAAVIGECMDAMPFWIATDVRTRVEEKLVSRAPSVRVSDLKRIFAEMLDRLDPDGEEPPDSHDRSKYRVNVRQRRDGDWDLSGLLDPISGGILQGWLTSRIKADDPTTTGTAGKEEVGSGGAENARSSATGNAGSPGSDTNGPGGDLDPITGQPHSAGDQEIVDLFSSVLSGDVSDARVPTDLTPGATDCGTSRGWGVREDGAFVDTSEAQGSVKNLIYERFATMISRIEMDRVGKGAPFALVVNATAEHLAEKKGRAATGAEAEFPIDLAVDEGLNGSVFFHLMGDKAKSLSLATENRHATAKQLAILAARDQGCTFPGCETPPGWCDAHHIVPWSMGGKTELNNLTLACGMHHHLIDRSDWYAYTLFDGRPAWIPPASIDVERRPILHARFIAREAAETLFDEPPHTAGSSDGRTQQGSGAAVPRTSGPPQDGGPPGASGPSPGSDLEGDAGGLGPEG
ncbi:DUF222 domain-containing protein [Brevibacterium casei]|uniref:HNH endonuclease signature motif containing protein n=1 Tax=Brevibacterium casei TaxID=33889 RepID=UPI003F7E4783